MKADGESEDLKVHVAACSERYKTLFRGLETLTNDVRDIKRQHWRAAVAVMGACGAVILLLVKIAWDLAGLAP